MAKSQSARVLKAFMQFSDTKGPKESITWKDVKSLINGLGITDPKEIEGAQETVLLFALASGKNITGDGAPKLDTTLGEIARRRANKR